MNNVMGVIVFTELKDVLKELTANRSLAAVPFGARYRLVDFALSNLVNAGVRNVGVFVQEKYRSLMDHLGNGKEWDLNRRRDGLFILPPEKYADGSTTWLLNGDILLLRRHLDYLYRSKQEYVILITSPLVYNIDLNDVLSKHLQSEADITVVYRNFSDGECNGSFTELSLDTLGRINDIKISPLLSQSSKLSLDTFVLKREALIRFVDLATSTGGHDFVKDILIRNISKLRIQGYEFGGYARKINSLECYYHTNMELLQPMIYQELFFANGLIFTKVKNEPPTRYEDSAVVKNSLVANGCKIGGTVEGSIVFRGVKIAKNAKIKNSIIMQKADISEGVSVENVVIDKDCTIGAGKRLKGDTNYPLVLSKATIL
ncbi:MAG TPA: glucose-1-phosphate adenylyltransferase subunit GlgD [Firmicutes bacterium]|mgnify:FL=1|nr:glucose-1-phosphate adenylyltransferase subunit GlgD [Bacillota bacterium]